LRPIFTERETRRIMSRIESTWRRVHLLVAAALCLSGVMVFGCQHDADEVPAPENVGEAKQAACGGPFVCLYGQTCCNGVCVYLNTDEANCGTCGNACDAGETCCGGTCADIDDDDDHCGSCGNACPDTSHGDPRSCNGAGDCRIDCTNNATGRRLAGGYNGVCGQTADGSYHVRYISCSTQNDCENDAAAVPRAAAPGATR
jgi:hypothetical protein